MSVTCDFCSADAAFVMSARGANTEKVVYTCEAHRPQARPSDAAQPPADIMGLLRDLVIAADRMADRWAESDKAVRNQLWRDLHRAATAAHPLVYPL